MVIVDLFRQREAVAEYTRDMTDGQRIEWIRQRGTLSQLDLPDKYPSSFIFRSNTGIESKFFVRDGQIVFIGDHTTIP